MCALHLKIQLVVGLLLRKECGVAESKPIKRLKHMLTEGGSKPFELRAISPAKFNNMKVSCPN